MLKSNIAKSVAVQSLVFIVNVLTGFLYTPYLLDKIGAEAYAFYPLSFSIINYASILTVIFTAMLSKYITVDYHNGNILRMNEFFNSSLRGNFIIGIAVGIPMLIGSLFTDSILSVPKELSLQVKILFMLITASFFIIQIRNTFMVANIATGKRYLTGFQKLIERISLVIIPVILFIFLKPSLIYIGISVFFAVTIRLFVTVKTQRRIMPQLKLSQKYVKKEATKIIILSGVWYAFIQFIALLTTNVEILLANRIFGAEIQSEYSISVIIPNLIRSMMIYLTNAILPFMALLFKNENYDGLKKSIPGFTKCMAVFMAIIISVIIGFGDTFLKLWIPDFHSRSIYILMSLSSLSVMVTGSFSILYSVLVVYDKLKLPAVIMLILGIINIPLSVFMSRFFDIYGILISSLIVNILGYMLFIPYYLKRAIKFKLKEVYFSFLKGVYVLLTGIFLCTAVKAVLLIDSFVKLVFAVLIVVLILILVLVAWVFDKWDFKFITDIIKTNIEYGDDIELREYDSPI